jgi:hypothetical protein
MCDDQKMEIMKLIMDYRMNDTSQIFTREQLIGEVRGVEWVRELVSGTYARLQEEAKSEPPV